MDNNIVLVGFMGTGKTVRGRHLSTSLNRPFVDMDAVIEERTGKTIPDIFAQDGEPHFRMLERGLVQELSAKKGLVIATGGGVVLNPENIADFQRTGLVVCLYAHPQIILDRVSKESHRPLLENDDKAKAIRELLAQRESLYRAIPIRIDTGRHSVEETTKIILSLLEEKEF